MKGTPTIHHEGLAEAFADPSKLLKKFKSMNPNTEGFTRTFMIHYLLTSKSVMKKRNKPSKPPGGSSGRASGRPFRRVPEGIVVLGAVARGSLPLQTIQWDRLRSWGQRR